MYPAQFTIALYIFLSAFTVPYIISRHLQHEVSFISFFLPNFLVYPSFSDGLLFSAN